MREINSTAIPAKFDGLCVPCGEDIVQGEPIILHESAGWIHEDCAEDVGKVVQTPADALNSNDRVRHPATVLPRGKTASDRCDRCFQIPSSNGSCGCDA